MPPLFNMSLTAENTIVTYLYLFAGGVGPPLTSLDASGIEIPAMVNC